MICTAELRGLEARRADFEASRVTVLAVGAVTPEEAKAVPAGFPVLADEGLEVARRYGLFHEKGFMGRDVPRPATLLVGPDRTIRWMHLAGEIRTRPSPEAIFAELRK